MKKGKLRRQSHAEIYSFASNQFILHPANKSPISQIVFCHLSICNSPNSSIFNKIARENILN